MPKVKTYSAVVFMKVYSVDYLFVKATSKSEASKKFDNICKDETAMNQLNFDTDGELVAYGIEKKFVSVEKEMSEDVEQCHSQIMSNDETSELFHKMAGVGYPTYLKLVVNNG